jgi:DNA-binding NtrC family response regulator
MPKKILLIDDDFQLCEEIAEILRDEGYFVDNASDETQSEALIKNNTYDICLLDYKMPHLTGIDLLKKIKEKNPRCAGLIVSGRPFIQKIIEEQNASHLVSGIIEKPFEMKAILDKIKELSPL